MCIFGSKCWQRQYMFKSLQRIMWMLSLTSTEISWILLLVTSNITVQTLDVFITCQSWWLTAARIIDNRTAFTVALPYASSSIHIISEGDVCVVKHHFYVHSLFCTGQESREYGHRDPSCWPRGTRYLQKLALISPTSSRLIGILRSRTQAMEFSLCCFVADISKCDEPIICRNKYIMTDAYDDTTHSEATSWMLSIPYMKIPHVVLYV
jgi:hypothetical protein